MIKVSFFAMVRIVLQFGGEYLFQLLMWIGAVTALVAVVSALAQSDVKRLLAYHSISQLGYILAVFGAGSSIALTASFFHALNHALFKSLLFLTVGAAVSFTKERNLYRIDGLGRKMPVFAGAFFIGALSISGIPPFNGFASKVFITMGMKNSAAYPLLWITSFLTLASFIKLGRIFIPSPMKKEQENGRLPGTLETIAVVTLALTCLATGIFGRPIAGFLHQMLYGSALQAAPELFSWAGILKVLPAMLLGTAAFSLVTTTRGKAVSARVKALAPQLQLVLVFFFVGLLAFAAVAW
jgi:multicomponent Na+:H+ antiporter subunit D